MTEEDLHRYTTDQLMGLVTPSLMRILEAFHDGLTYRPKKTLMNRMLALFRGSDSVIRTAASDADFRALARCKGDEKKALQLQVFRVLLGLIIKDYKDYKDYKLSKLRGASGKKARKVEQLSDERFDAACESIYPALSELMPEQCPANKPYDGEMREHIVRHLRNVAWTMYRMKRREEARFYTPKLTIEDICRTQRIARPADYL
jgi:hypothetical protein